MKEKLLAFWASLKSKISAALAPVIAYLAKIAAPVLSVLLLILGVLAAIEYKSLLMKWYAWLSKKELESATKEDNALKAQEDADKAKAAQAIADSQNVKPDPDWYKK